MSLQEFNIYGGLNACKVASTTNLSGIYHNGQSNNGVGAKLILGMNLLVIDNVLVQFGDRILVCSQNNINENGIYICIQEGNSQIPTILQRSNDLQSIPQIKLGQYIIITSGVTNSGSIYNISSPIPDRLGVDPFIIKLIGPGSSNSPLSPYVVSPTGNFTTIQAAIDQAVADGAAIQNIKVILISPGIYQENLSLGSFVNLVGVGNSSLNSVVVQGNSTYTPNIDNDTFAASGITFLTPISGGAALSIEGTNISSVDCINCEFSANNGIGFQCVNQNASCNLHSVMMIASAGQKTCNIENGNISAVGATFISTDTPASISGNGNLIIFSSKIFDSFLVTDTSTLAMISCGSQVPANLPLANIDSGSLGIFSAGTVASMATSGYFLEGTGSVLFNSITPIVGFVNKVDPALNIFNVPLLLGNLSFDGGITKLDTDGQLIIGSSTGQPKISNLIAGPGITITNGDGTITISAP